LRKAVLFFASACFSLLEGGPEQSSWVMGGSYAEMENIRLGVWSLMVIELQKQPGLLTTGTHLPDKLTYLNCCYLGFSII
jgi:hypothetical protein